MGAIALSARIRTAYAQNLQDHMKFHLVGQESLKNVVHSVQKLICCDVDAALGHEAGVRDALRHIAVDFRNKTFDIIDVVSGGKNQR